MGGGACILKVNNHPIQEPDAFLDNSEGSRESFDILAWIRLSKLRYSRHLINHLHYLKSIGFML